MKLGNHDIHALAKKLFHHKQGAKRAKLMHPKRDWLIGGVVGLMIIVVMISWSAYTYLEKRDAIELTDTSVEPVVPVYNADTVQDALEIFAAREELFTQLNQPGAPVQVQSPPEDDFTQTASATASSTIDLVPDEEAEEVVADQESEQIASPQSDAQGQPADNEEDVGTPTLIQ